MVSLRFRIQASLFRRASPRIALFFLAFLVTRLSFSAVCTPTAATLCASGDDYVDVWINGNCVLTCVNDFPYIDSSLATPVKCVSVPVGILSPTGLNSVAVRVRDTQPSEAWGTWALDIVCSNGGHSVVTSSDPFEFYHDSNGSSPPPLQAGLPWYDPNYVAAPAWGAPSAVAGSVFGKRAIDPQTGQPLTAMSWNSAASSSGADMLYFRQSFQLTPQPTPIPASMTVSYAINTGTCGVDSGVTYSMAITVCNTGGISLQPVTITVTLPSQLSFTGPYSGTSNPVISQGPPVTLIWTTFPGSSCLSGNFTLTDYYIGPGEYCNNTHTSIDMSYDNGVGSAPMDVPLHCCVPPSPVPTPTPSSSSTPVYTPTVTPTASPSFTPSPSFSASPSFTATKSATTTLTQTLTFSPSHSFTFSPTRTPTPTLTVTFSVSPTYSVSPTIRLFTSLIKFRAIFPNPFVDSGQIVYSLGEDAEVKMTVYNVAGEIVTIQSQAQLYGMNVTVWKGDNESGGRCASGIYLLHVEAKANDRSEGFWTQAVIAR